MEKSVNTVSYPLLPPDGSQIRLVTIVPSKSAEEVQCLLKHHEFRKGSTGGLNYEALSYVWGDATKTVPIRLNGHKFQVTTNLESSLRALRYLEHERHIWIDAICINQSNVEERNQEVRRMGQIYRNALRVVIWLGCGTGFGNIISLLPTKPNRSLRPADDTCSVLNSLATANTNVVDAAAIILQKTDDQLYYLLLLSKFFGSAWFSRVWVLQEIALAKTAIVGYGDNWLQWDQLLAAVDTLRRIQLGRNKHIWGLSNANGADRVRRCCIGLLNSQEQGFQPNGYNQLINLLWQTRYFAMTDRRDRFYALFGLMTDEFMKEKWIEVDYKKPAADVILELNIFLIRGGYLSHVLCAITKTVSDLPSWATDWTASIGTLGSEEGGIFSISSIESTDGSRLSSGITAYMQSYQLRGIKQRPYVFYISPDSRQLTLRGIIVESLGIQHVGHRFGSAPFQAFNIHDRLKFWQQHLVQWESDMERQECSRVRFKTPDERRAAWKQAILHELPLDPKKPSLHLSQESSAVQMQMSHTYDLLTKTQGELPTEEPLLMRMLSDITSHLGINGEYRRPFITMLGQMGSTGTNCDLRRQDVICLFDTCSVPCILRPLNRLKSQYSFISCCWVSTLMNIDIEEGKSHENSKFENITLL
jgi:hypothetical protein